jgi:glycosyltransferase involved in cell wall biosynthesis
MRCANARIAISGVIAELIYRQFSLDATLIPNGVVVPEILTSTDALERFELQSRRYFLQVSRVVPEKRQIDLIEAFSLARPPNWKLVLVGGLDSTSYCDHVKRRAKDEGVVLTDFLSGIALQQLYSHAGAFVLPSSHEGLPIALLEALSYALPVIASDIPANREVGLDHSSYFPVGNVQALALALSRIASEPAADPEGLSQRREWVSRNYNWDRISAQTLDVYKEALEL